MSRLIYIFTYPEVVQSGGGSDNLQREGERASGQGKGKSQSKGKG